MNTSPLPPDALLPERLSGRPTWLRWVYGAGAVGLLNLGFWVIDAIWRFANPGLVITPPASPQAASWPMLLFRHVPPYAWFLRAVFLGITLLGGLLYAYIAARQHRRLALARAQTRRYQTLFEKAPIGLAVTTLEGRLLMHNIALRQMRRAADADLQQINVTDWYANPSERKRLLTQLQSTGQAQHFETKLKRIDDEIYDTSLTAALIPWDDQEVIVTVMEDITEARRLRDKLLTERSALARQVEKHTATLLTTNAELTQALRVKDEFLAIMSHELRTPLTSIMTLADNLSQEIYGPLSDRQKAPLHAIQESGYNLLNLINDMVDLAKIGAGQLKLQLTPFSVAQVCELALQTVRTQAQKKDITLSLEIDPAVEMMIADAGRVRQMLTKLLHNAVNFTPIGGKAGLEVHGDADQTGIHFTVWDTGVGIPPEKIGQLFQAFNQLDTSSARDYDGTGVGLALVDRLARLHEGIISVQSHPGQGSRFTLSLPWQNP